MTKKYFISSVIVAILIFASYTWLHSLAKLLPTNESDYTLNTPEMNIHHKPPLFYLQENKTFFVHPASEANATGYFKFKRDEKLQLHLSIQKGSRVGAILFVVTKNNNEKQKFLVDTKHEAFYKTKIKEDDTLTITANSYGTTAGDWGNVQILKYEPHYLFKLRLIPLLWVLFIIYATRKGYFFTSFYGYFGFLLSLYAEKLNYGVISFEDTLIYSLIFWALTLVFIFIYQLLAFAKKFKVATFITWIGTIISYTVPLSVIGYNYVFGQKLDVKVITIVYQTNPQEALEFIKTFVPTPYIISFLVLVLIIGFTLFYQESKPRKNLKTPLILFLILLFIAIVSTRFSSLRISHLIKQSYENYNFELNRFKELQEKRKQNKIKFNATKKEQGETYVVVIGESLSKLHMGLYGYYLNTSPNLIKQKRNDLMLFDNAYTNYTATMQSLSLALTEANQYNHKKYFNSLSIVDIFNKAGFKTYWITNQALMSNWDNFNSVVAHQADKVVSLNPNIGFRTDHTLVYDEATVPHLAKALKRDKSNKIIFIHLIGSHFFYQNRYPDSKKLWNKPYPKFLTSDLSQYQKNRYVQNNNLLYQYDNSVYYNDYVVNKLLKTLQKNGDISAFLYFSDHAEDPVRGLAHNPGLFTYEMAQIPMIAWLSPKYKERYPQTAKTLLEHNNTLFSNDMIYDTVIGLAHIKTDHYNPIYDFTSPKYYLNPSKAYIFKGRYLYTASNNYIYWQKINTNILQRKSYYNKLIINNTDSVGKLNEAWRLGFRAFKLNLYYMADKKSFQTGTDKYDTGGNLIDTLSYFKKDKIEHLMLHLANLSKDNLDAILERLNTIKSKLPSQEKITLLVENSNFIEPLKAKGWRVALKSSQLAQSSADSLVIDIKNLKKEQIQNSSTSLIINHAFNLANSKLEKKLSSLEYLNSGIIGAILVDFKSEYQW